MMQHKWPIVAVAIVPLVVLAACSGSGGRAAATRQPSSSVGIVVEPPVHYPYPIPPAAPVPGARSGGTLTVLSDHGIATLDPTEAYYTTTQSILTGLVVRTLTQYVYDRRSRQMILVPDLATTLGASSSDYRTWRFTLRRGVRFENGRLVTPEDVKYGIERSFDRRSFPTGPDYSNEYFLNGATYKGPYRSPGDYQGVTISGRTITIKMSKPFPGMPYWGAFSAMSPIPPGPASDPATYRNHPWATGPYMFKSYTPGQSLVLVKNPRWDPNTDPGRHQYVDELDFNFATDSASIDRSILADSGSAATTLSYDSVLAGDYERFDAEAGDRLIRGMLPCTAMWAIDNRKVTDIRVRQALAWAYPYRATWTAGGAIPGVTRFPADNLMTPGLPGWAAYNPLPGHTPGTTDPARARALLAQAGALGYPIRFAYLTDDPPSVAVKDVIVNALMQAGFDPRPVATTLATMSKDITHNANAPVDVRAVGWCSDYPSGAAWLPPTFETTDIAKEGLGTNFSAFSEPAVDRRMDAIQRLPLSKQPAAWNALDRQIQTTYFPVVVTGYFGVAMMRGSKVHGAANDSVNGMPTWKDIWLD